MNFVEYKTPSGKLKASFIYSVINVVREQGYIEDVVLKDMARIARPSGLTYTRALFLLKREGFLRDTLTP